MKRHRLLRALRIGLIAVAAVAVCSLVVMGLWNALMPSIFAVRAIGFWEAAGLLLLSKLLFGGFRGHRGGGGPWRRRMMERWGRMTPEEREKLKQGMRRGCGPRRNPEGFNDEVGGEHSYRFSFISRLHRATSQADH